MMVTQFNDVFYKWGLLFAQSLYFTNPKEELYIDSVNLNGGQVKELSEISPLITLKNNQISFPSDVNVPAYMANRRVKVLLEVIGKKQSDKYVIIDADMLFRKSLDKLYEKVNDSDASIIFRDGMWEGVIYEHLKVACGLVVITQKGIPLIREWYRIMCGEKSIYGYRAWEWYWDQIALLEATRRVKDIKYSSIEPDLYINRDFGKDAYIWSANKAPKDYMYQEFVKEFEKNKSQSH